VTPQPLEGRVAVLSGATSDIGQAIGRRLASAGARLRLLGRDRATLEPLAEKLRAVCGDVRSFPIDLGVDASLLALGSGLDRVDILVHGAGAYEMGKIERAPIADLDHQYRVNVRGPLLLTQALLARLREARGEIVFLNSTLGLEARHRSLCGHAARAPGGGGCRADRAQRGRHSRAHPSSGPHRVRETGPHLRPRRAGLLAELAGATRGRRGHGAGGRVPAAYGRSDGDPHAAHGQVVLSGVAAEARNWRT